jgi:predicted O-linked N-acetylglucosamine transferase (SPINDLY family)
MNAKLLSVLKKLAISELQSNVGIGRCASPQPSQEKAHQRGLFHCDDFAAMKHMTQQSLCDQAVRLHQQGQWDEAAWLYQQAMDGDSAAFVPRHLLGILRLQQGRNEEALALIGAALKINPDHAEALVNYGNALKQCGRAEDALASFDQALALKPDYAGAPYNRAILLADLGRMDQALESYARALAIRPDFAAALHERALLLQALKRNSEALADFDRLLALNADLTEAWNNRGVLLEDLSRFDEALASFDLVLGRNPNFAEAWHNRGNILGRLRRFDEALASYDRALALKPSVYPKAWINRGILLMEMRRFADAMDSFSRALAIDPDDAGALHQRGRLAWLEFRNYDAALADLERAVALEPERTNALGDLTYLKMHGGDWRDRARDIALLNEGVRAGKPVVEPFIYQALSDSPADLQACAMIHAARRFPLMAGPHKSAKRKPGKIRVGYLSGEFREQATAYLTAGLYECHDKQKFEIIAFDNGVNDRSPMRNRLESAFDKFADISKLSDAAAAALIASHEIDILVNLNGYFGESRTGIIAQRPAPIQVNFLGFPGTLGASCMDYIIADDCVIPENETRYYTEKMVRLPGSYQVNDWRRAIADTVPSRPACGLPPGGFVFCSFNQSYKLAPEIFARWMAILKQTPESVLWLLEGHPRFAENIRREATAAGVESERIVFAPKLAVEDHLARLTLADLFLDTLPYNAHTTASDALWAGVPLITCRGTSFPGRVAASLLMAVGLAELVTENLDAYQALAVKLAGDPALLAGLRKKLAENRLVSPLFDTVRYARNLEAAYLTMIQTWQNAKPPEDFAVSLTL